MDNDLPILQHRSLVFVLDYRWFLLPIRSGRNRSAIMRYRFVALNACWFGCPSVVLHLRTPLLCPRLRCGFVATTHYLYCNVVPYRTFILYTRPYPLRFNLAGVAGFFAPTPSYSSAVAATAHVLLRLLPFLLPRGSLTADLVAFGICYHGAFTTLVLVAITNNAAALHCAPDLLPLLPPPHTGFCHANNAAVIYLTCTHVRTVIPPRPPPPSPIIIAVGTSLTCCVLPP